MGQEYELQQVLYKVYLQVEVKLEDEVVVVVTCEVVVVTHEVVEVTREVVEVICEVVEVTREVVEVICEVGVMVVALVHAQAAAVDDVLFQVASLHLGHDAAGIEDDCPAKMPLDKNAPAALFVVPSVDALLHDDLAHDANAQLPPAGSADDEIAHFHGADFAPVEGVVIADAPILVETEN